eukprot:1022406-Amorphochlora_amoeboformis.AAC.1
MASMVGLESKNRSNTNMSENRNDIRNDTRLLPRVTNKSAASSANTNHNTNNNTNNTVNNVNNANRNANNNAKFSVNKTDNSNNFTATEPLFRSTVVAHLAHHQAYVSTCRFVEDQPHLMLTASGDSNCILHDVNTQKYIMPS